MHCYPRSSIECKPAPSAWGQHPCASFENFHNFDYASPWHHGMTENIARLARWANQNSLELMRSWNNKTKLIICTKRCTWFERRRMAQENAELVCQEHQTTERTLWPGPGLSFFPSLSVSSMPFFLSLIWCGVLRLYANEMAKFIIYQPGVYTSQPVIEEK
jgi:hypothetical protein